ncbi:MAG: hypothetical protein CMK07_11215 [Ponticaulis sp.]|nr:hypothetical protein [Ponticaulis sp.]
MSALSLMTGTTTHVRFMPFKNQFTYPVRMINIDVDQCEQASEQSRWFSVNRFNVVGFRTADHGDHGETSLKDWASERFRQAGINLADGRIRLITFPSVWGFKFSPISIWLLTSGEDRVRGVIYEVHNTFGDDHAYVAKVANDASRHVADREFHVSPFFDVSGQYRFTLTSEDQTFSLLIENLKDGQRPHTANLVLERSVANDVSFAKLAFLKPLSALAVTLRIHWQALKLWRKGAKYHSRKQKTSNQVTLADKIPEKEYEQLRIQS